MTTDRRFKLGGYSAYFVVTDLTVGLLRRPEKANAAPLEEGDQELVCLEAFCLR